MSPIYKLDVYKATQDLFLYRNIEFNSNDHYCNFYSMASALFNFTARHNDELSVSEGESVSIVEMINDEWAHCFNPASGRSGIVPLSFLHLYANEENEKESCEDIDIKYCTSFDGSSELVSALDEHDESALPGWRC